MEDFSIIISKWRCIPEQKPVEIVKQLLCMIICWDFVCNGVGVPTAVYSFCLTVIIWLICKEEKNIIWKTSPILWVYTNNTQVCASENKN